MPILRFSWPDIPTEVLLAVSLRDVPLLTVDALVLERLCLSALADVPNLAAPPRPACRPLPILSILRTPMVPETDDVSDPVAPPPKHVSTSVAPDRPSGPTSDVDSVLAGDA